MPLIYNNPWTQQAEVGQGIGNSLGEVLMRVPQIRAQAAMMQQQLALEQQKAANEQQYQQGMIGYHNRALDVQQPEIAARSNLQNQQAAEVQQKMAEQQKLMSLAVLFGQAQRNAMKLPTRENYQGGPTVANEQTLNQGDLVQSLSTLQALRPQGDPMGTALQLQAQQQQPTFSQDQLNALLTGGHINTPRPEPLGIKLGPGQNYYGAPGNLLIQGPPPLPHAATRDTRDQIIRDVANRMAQQNSAPADDSSWGKILGMTNLLSTAQSSQQLPTIKTKAEFDKLASGTKYIGPSGKVATKP